MLKIKLYHCFSKWLEFDNVVLYSDPHFGDSDMTVLRTNNISDEEQLKRINSKCGKKTVFICLGDCGDLSFVSKIKAGYKVLIKGNHDDKGDSYYQRVRNEIKCFSTESEEVQAEIAKCIADINLFDKLDEVVKKYTTVKVEDNHLFDEVYSGPVWIAEKILLSHEPIDIPYAFNIHGHDHSNWFTNDHHLNLCAEHIDYTPVSLVALFKNGAFSKVDSIHRRTIDNATERKLNKK